MRSNGKFFFSSLRITCVQNRVYCVEKEKKSLEIHLIGDLFELSQRAHRTPHASLDHQREREALVRQLSPAAPQNDLVQCTHETASRLTDKDHIGL